MPKFKVNIYLWGVWGILGNPGIFYRSCWLLPLLSESTPVPHHTSPFTTFCVPDLNVGSALFILE